jgi:hypothetical protein
MQSDKLQAEGEGMTTNGPRIRREKQTVAAMIDLYCHDQHGANGALCPECGALHDYAMQRLDRCPFGEEKSTCADCTIHCYKPAMRERIRVVMRYAGPRMIWRHPLLAVRHVLDGRK